MNSEIFSPKPADNLGNKGYFPETAQKLPPTLPKRFPMSKLPPERPIRFPKSPERPKKPLSKKAVIASLAATLFVIANAGMGVKYHIEFETPNTPAGIVEDIKGIPIEWQYTLAKWQQNQAINERLDKPISPIFDNKVDSQLVQAGVNASPVSENELPVLLKDAIKPLAKDQFPDITILLPLRLMENEKIDIKTDWVNGALNPITQKPDRLAYGKIITISKKGTEIIVPVDNAEISIGTRNVNGKDYFSGLGINFQGPDGTVYGLGIAATGDIRGLQPADIIQNALINGQKKITAPINTTIAITSSDNVEIKVGLGAKRSQLRSLNSNYSFATKIENGRTSIAFMPQKSP